MPFVYELGKGLDWGPRQHGRRGQPIPSECGACSTRLTRASTTWGLV